MEPKRRGRPPGTKNRPKEAIAEANGESKIARRVDDLLDVLINAAVLNQDVKTAQYLINRVYGRPTEKSEVTTKGEQTIKVEYVEDWRNQ